MTTNLPNRSQHLGYYINLDERGSFRADVRNMANGKTVYNICAGDELRAGETSIFEDGYMKHKDDLDGLLSFLKEMGIASENARLTKEN